jgi:uncharacterized Zn finger protein (UPF0148 family)
MKCDLCKGPLGTGRVLCDSCGEAIRRLVRITTGPSKENAESARAMAAHGMAA